MVQNKTLLESNRSKDEVDTATLTGRILKDRYELEAHIGSGGMSDIYKAKDLLLSKAGVDDPYVAIKVLQPQYTKNKEAQQLLFREAHKTMALSHPNIIRVYDVDKEDKLCFITMEWINGETLDQVISRSKPKGLTYKGAEKIISQVADALKFAHKNGIVHTDLKPANIMHTRNGDIKIFDFGV
ncbi:MAG: serine/threonine protein kinase, partial [Moritella dasanensis]